MEKEEKLWRLPIKFEVYHVVAISNVNSTIVQAVVLTQLQY